MVKMYDVGIGVTDACNSNCLFCYSQDRRNKTQNNFEFLDFNLLKKFINKFPIRSINFGTGEFYLYPRYKELLEYTFDSGIDCSLTSNGSTILRLPDYILEKLHDVDVSIDFADASQHNEFRGHDAFNKAIKAIEKCKKLDVPVSITSILMAANAEQIVNVSKIAANYEAYHRINIFKAVRPDLLKFQLSYAEFWKAIAKLMTQPVVSCSEPIVEAAFGAGSEGAHNGSECGHHSIRIRPDGTISSCVYLKSIDDSSIITLDQAVKDPDMLHIKISNIICSIQIPPVCEGCRHLSVCKGGCIARRHYHNGIELPDEFCFMEKGLPLDDSTMKLIKANFAKSEMEAGRRERLVHENYLCTLILAPEI